MIRTLIAALLSLVGGFAGASPRIMEADITADSKPDDIEVLVDRLPNSELVRFTITSAHGFYPREDGALGSIRMLDDGKTIFMVELSGLTNSEGRSLVSFVLNKNFLERTELTIFVGDTSVFRAYHIDLKSFYDVT